MTTILNVVPAVIILVIGCTLGILVFLKTITSVIAAWKALIQELKK
ncbi:hypothetical protein [Companilactobacillus mishanensis]|nr:hypothetical protein [Companilactobacillus mishanensis]